MNHLLLKKQLNNEKNRQIRGKIAKSLSTFCKNKPNSPEDKFGLKHFSTRIYERFHPLAGQKNKPNQTQFKANTNPILAQKSGGQSQFKPNQTQFKPMISFCLSLLIYSGYNLEMQKWMIQKQLNPVSRGSILIILLTCSFVLPARSRELNPPEQDWFPKTPALPSPSGSIIEVSGVQQLMRALREVKPGQTILLADGHYMMPHYVQISTDNVTLRSASGDRRRVIIDGAKSRHGELLGISACSGVTIADLTIQNIKWNGFKINSNTNVQKLTIYNCIIHNIWQRGIKGVKVPKENREVIRPKDYRIQYCLFYNDRPKRLSDDEADIAKGNYVAGIDVMYAADWIISDNVFVGIQGKTYEGRGAVFIWHDSQDCVIERNIIIDCDVGLQLGNPHRDSETIYHCVRCIAKNNFITRAPEAGIVTVYTRDCKVLNNTIHDPESRLGRLIRTVFTNDGLIIANNLLSGPGIRNESQSKITLSNNLIRDYTDFFIDPANGNLHLKNAAIDIVDKGIPLTEIQKDIDGVLRRTRPDIGADELEN